MFDLPHPMDISSALARIHRRDAYLDTVRVYVNRFLRKEDWDVIDAFSDTSYPLTQMPEQPMFRSGVSVNRPRPELLAYFNENFSRHCIVRADVALDFVCEPRDLIPIRYWLESTLVMPNSRKSPRTLYENTLYYAPGKAARNLTIYTDNVSRIDENVSCIHVEWRTRTARMLRDVGMSTLPDLLAVSLGDFVKMHLSLWHLPDDIEAIQKIGRMVLGKTKRRALVLPRSGRYQYDRFGRVGGTYMRNRRYSGTDSAHDVWNLFGGRVRKMLEPIDAEAFMPTHFPINGAEASAVSMIHLQSELEH